jgi:regulator of replication initiation timing
VEMIAILEKKIEGLIELLRTLKMDNTILRSENQQLKDQIVRLEDSLLKENKQFEQKLTVTEKAVSDLLKSIDELIESEG